MLRYPASATDPDGDTLVYDLVVKPAGMGIHSSSGLVFWQPTADQVDTHDVLLRVQDGRGGVALQPFTVTVSQPNTAPRITSHPTGPAVADLPYEYQVYAQDADGDSISYGLVSPPAGMTIDETSGLLTWTPTPAQAGISHHVAITASDGRGGETTQMFDLPVVATAPNDPPRITSAPRYSIRLGGTYLHQIVASDPNGDPLSYILTTAPAGMSVDDDGLVVWEPTGDQLGPNPVEIRVEDGRGGVAVQGFSVTVLTQGSNSAPTIISNPSQVATVGREYQYNAKADDPDGDPLVWGLDTAPAGMSINTSLGTVRWTPTSSQIGPRAVIVRVIDGQGGFSTQTYTINVRSVNVPPGITSTPPTNAYVDETYSYAVRATDPEDAPLTFSLTTAPAGMTIDPASGFVEWTPNATQVDSHAVVIRVEDGQGGFAVQNYTVEVNDTASNEYPVITSTAPSYAPVGELYQYQVTATDPDGDPLEFLLLTDFDGMSIGTTTGLIEWTPTPAQLGEHQVIVAAVDPLGAGGTQSFPVVVYESNENPMIDSPPVQVVYAGLPYRYDVRAHDDDGDPLGYDVDGPEGMIIDSMGRVTWSPGIPDVGTHRIEITVSDDRGGWVMQSYDLVVMPDLQTPLVDLLITVNPASLGEPVTFVVSATDNIGVVSKGLTINGWPFALDSAGRMTLLADPVGEYEIVASATDAAGNTGLATTTFSVFDFSDQQAPDVDITSPADQEVVTSPVDVIGTADDPDDNLLYYRLVVAPVGSEDFVEMFRGETEVVDGVLGTFDPTALANGAYRLRLEATDSGGNTSYIENTIEVAGDLKIGNFTLSFTDLSVPVSGIPITVTRTYDSLNAGTADDLGYGWRLEFRDTDLRSSVPSLGEFEEELGYYNPFREGSRVYVTVPGGRRQAFTFQPTPVSGFAGLYGLYNPTFVPDSGVTSSLSVPQYTLVRNEYGEYFGANSLAYNPADSLNFGGVYYLTTEDGLLYKIDAKTGDLSVISDANGNSLTFTDTAITSSAGPRVTFGHDPQGRIISATDPDDNQVRYEYDAAGDLVSVTDVENNRTQFVYDEPSRPHFLTEVIDPLGRTGVRTEYDDQGRLVTLIDADGNPVGIAHDPENFLETVTDALGNTTAFEYDIRGNVVTEVDALGNITRRTYDLANNMLSETDPETGLATVFSYDSWGNMLAETDPLGNVTINTYTTFVPGAFAQVRGARPTSWLASTTDPLGNTTSYAHDGAGNVLTSTDTLGNVTTYTYDSAGNQTSITDAAGNTIQFEYDTSSYMIRQVDALGNETTYTYDDNGNQLTETTTVTTPSGPRVLVTTTVPDAAGRPVTVTDAEGNTTTTEYDELGNQSATIDALDHRTEFRYDDRGQLVGMDFADGTSTAMAYDVLGRRISSTDRAGRVTRYEYDALGRLTATIYPDATPDDAEDNPRTKTEYDAAGRVTAQIDELGHRTEFEYDDAGRQVLVRDALGNETTTAYDAAGRRLSQTDALGRTTRFIYDELGRLVTSVYPDDTPDDDTDNSTAQTTYDALGRVTAQTDQNGYVTQFEYDDLGRLTAVVDALLQRTEYGYDEAGNLVTQTDANSHVTSYEYDGLGRRIATELPLGQRSSTTHDAAGNVETTTDFNGQTITYEYDVNNRLLFKRYPGGSSVGFTYTATGRRESVTDTRGVTTYHYDVRDRLLSRTDYDGTADARHISYGYDDAGNRTSVTTPSGRTDYTFDALNRMETVTDPDSGLTGYLYNEVGALVRTELPNGTVETREYDELNRLVYLENTLGTEVISSYRYTLDAVGNRTKVVEDTGRTVDYAYDNLYRLLGESITDSAAGDRTIGYGYDPVGNRLTRDDSIEGLTTYEYDANDRLLLETLAGDETRYTYDANGNTLTKTSPTEEVLYKWDFENRLVAVDTDADGTNDIQYHYNADGIKVASISGGEETRYLIDANRPYAQVLEEYTPGGIVKVSYVHGLDLISQNRPATTGKSFYHFDGLGSTRALTNASGLVTDTYIYDAFGRTIGQVGSTGNVYLFAGEQRDLVTGLDYLRARWMSPSVGRFYGMDPYAGVLREPVSLHRFLYAGANPVMNIDPNGEFSLAVAVATVAVLGVVSAVSPQPAFAIEFAKANKPIAAPATLKGTEIDVGPDLVATFLEATLSVEHESGGKFTLLGFGGGGSFIPFFNVAWTTTDGTARFQRDFSREAGSWASVQSFTVVVGYIGYSAVNIFFGGGARFSGHGQGTIEPPFSVFGFAGGASATVVQVKKT